jgi:hypothetical protein
MAWTQADLDTLDAALAKAEKDVTFADRRVIYRSVDEMLAARSVIAASLSAASDTPRAKQFGVTVSKAL